MFPGDSKYRISGAANKIKPFPRFANALACQMHLKIRTDKQLIPVLQEYIRYSRNLFVVDPANFVANLDGQVCI